MNETVNILDAIQEVESPAAQSSRSRRRPTSDYGWSGKREDTRAYASYCLLDWHAQSGAMEHFGPYVYE